MPLITPASIDAVYDSIHIGTFESILKCQMKKAGSSYRCLSPWANEKTPSFFVFKGGTMYKDFSSGNGGTAVNLLMELENLTYPEAIERIASWEGITIEYDEKEPDTEKIEHLDELKSTLKWAVDHYAKYLHSQPDEHPAWADELRGKRQLDDESIHEWGIGYAPDEWHFLSKPIIDAGRFKPAEELGLLRTGSGGKVHDCFRKGITFPIHDERGHLVSVAIRTLDATPYKDKDGKERKPPKYINGPASEIYNKSAVLYGAHLAKKAIKIIGEAILVEGYYDVVSMHRAGAHHTVATCGTALTELQCKLLKRLGAKRILLCRDSDPAGQKAALRDFELLITYGFEVRIANLPDGMDPDDFARLNVAPCEKYEHEKMAV